MNHHLSYCECLLPQKNDSCPPSNPPPPSLIIQKPFVRVKAKEMVLSMVKYPSHSKTYLGGQVTLTEW